MATQLREVLNRFADQSAPMSLKGMARDMDIDYGVLCEMVQFWVRKGKLREISDDPNCTTCGVKSACPFIVTLPRRYELVHEGDSACDVSFPTCHCGG
jgi:hypothetical protein